MSREYAIYQSEIGELFFFNSVTALGLPVFVNIANIFCFYHVSITVDEDQSCGKPTSVVCSYYGTPIQTATPQLLVF